MSYTFRINYIKANDNVVEDTLNNIDIKYDILDIYGTKMYRINDEYIDILKNADIYKDGFIYVQNPSSVLPAIYLLNDDSVKEKILKKDNIDLLDMCAAPGGKTLALQSLSKNYFNVTAVERDKKRYERMKYNFANQNARVYTKHISAYDLDDFMKFDIIILDVPCTGSDSENKNLNLDYLNKLVYTQKKLIDKACKVLKNNGILLYSTCSVLKEEDEDQVEYMQKSKKLTKLLDKKISRDEIYEGFFIAKLLKYE